MRSDECPYAQNQTDHERLVIIHICFYISMSQYYVGVPPHN